MIQRGSDSETSEEENQIHDQDNVGPEESASHCASSTIRASRAARRAAAEVRSRVAQQRAAKEFEMAVVRQEIAVLEAETEENSLRAGEEAFARVLRNTVTPASQWKGESSIDLRPGRRSSIESQRTEPSQVSQQWRKSKPASQQWETSYPASQQRETSYPASQQWERPYPASQQRERSYLAPQQWKEELSFASHVDPQVTTQHNQRDRPTRPVCTSQDRSRVATPVPSRKNRSRKEKLDSRAAQEEQTLICRAKIAALKVKIEAAQHTAVPAVLV